jgi:hypothetical protein
MTGQQCCQQHNNLLEPREFCSTRFEVLSDVSQGSVFWQFIYDLFSDDFCSCTNHSKHWLLIDIKIIGTVSSETDCTLLQPDI